MEQIKPSTGIDYLKKMGISTLTEEDNSLALALGGLQKGISPLEMAGAYATIANDGEYIEPTFYKEVLNKARQTILKPKQEKRRVFSKEVAFILKNILTQPVVESNGTATYCKTNGVDVAAKTGTTDDNFDRWLCGFTPYYTAATWYGYDQNETVDFNNRNPAGLLWANIMSRIHTGLRSARFEKPNTVSSAIICADTGKKARTGCKNTYTEYFLWLTTPGLCDEHSGDEIGNTNSSTKQNKTNTQEVVQGITQDIDATEPPRTDLDESTGITNNQNTTTNTSEDTNTNNTTTTNRVNNTTNSSNTNTSTSNTTGNRANTNTGGSSTNTTSNVTSQNRVNATNSTTQTNGANTTNTVRSEEE